MKVVGGVSTHSVPEELRKAVGGKPLMSPEPPLDGWEIVVIVEQRPAIVEEVVAMSQGKFIVRVVAEAVMAARNMRYRSTLGEPLYWVSWVYKISWKPVVGAGGL